MLSKISLGINALLIAAVVYLFIQINKKAEVSTVNVLPENSAFNSTEGVKAPIMAYINGDSLNSKYKFIVDRSKALEQKYRDADAKVKREYQQREAEAQELAAYAQKGNIPDDEMRTIESRMQQLEMEIQQIQQQESDRVMKKEAELQKELQERVQKFLDGYAREKGIDFVVNYQPAVQFILFGNNAYDVTSEVIARLNAEYEQEQAEKK